MFIFDRIDRCRSARPLAVLACALALAVADARGESSRDPTLLLPSVAARATAENASVQRSTTGVFQTRLASQHGVGTISLMASGDVDNTRLARLDTTFATTLPGGRNGLRLGDSVSPSGTWGRSLRFGGVHFGTGLMSAAGAVRMPSWPGAARRFAAESVVPAAALGVPEDSPQFAQMARPAPDFLPPGAVYRNYAVGFLRSRYGLDGDRYGPVFASATLRRGLSPDVTAELRGGAQPGSGNCGIAFRLRVPHLGVVTAATAASDSDAGTGSLTQTGFQRSFAGFTTSVRAQWASRQFQYLGPRDEPVLPPRFWSVVRANYDTRRYGIVGVAYAALEDIDEDLKKAVKATYQIAVDRVGSLSLTASRTIAHAPETAVTLVLTLSLEQLARSVRIKSASAFAKPPGELAPVMTALR